uniref:DUF5899 domain-containing protein n=1 Tax=viral metagenome TaxID=1070528 RepID=A0A6C0BEJ7_9ZZZZ
MIELYVVVTLFALGYMINQSDTSKKTKQSQTINKSEIPSVNNIYDSRFCDVANSFAQKRSHSMVEASKNPARTGVISRNYKLNEEIQKKDQPLMKKRMKLMSGEEVDEMEFTHNNMIPFFGGSVKQSTDSDVNGSKLESFTGVINDYKSKCEVPSFFDHTKDASNPYGLQNMNDFYQDRIIAPKAQNNVTPIPKVYVGPGLNRGYSADPTGGFQQFDARDYALPKSVDDLRVKNKPKVTYEARTLDGVKAKLPGKIGCMKKNRVDTFFEQTPDMYLVTTGQNLKKAMIPEFPNKDTNRQSTSKEYTGTAVYQNAKGRTTDPYVHPSDRHVYNNYGIRNATLADYGTGSKDDFGKSSIVVFNNERDLTTTRVYQGNVTSMIKAIVAPIQDMLKITKKEGSVDNPRHFGNINPQIPDKPTIQDPNDVARTTIKETTIHEAILGNLKGNEKLTVYDPNDVARTTIKETTIHEALLGNLKGNEKLTVYDPNDVARTTIKETTIHEALLGNLKGNEKLTVYDPNDIARTTIKETLIHDEIGTGAITGPKQLYVYDPDEVAKKTLRETLERMDYELNMKSGVYKGKVYDPEDKARTTMKELTEMLGRDGNVGVKEREGIYIKDGIEAKNTQKQFLSDSDYYGIAAKENGNGYQIETFDMKKTHKQFLSDMEYFGTADSSDKKQMSYDDMMNARIHEKKESTLHGRDPTQQGSKVANGVECMNVKLKNNKCDSLSTRETNNVDRVYNTITHVADETFTKSKKSYEQINQERLDPTILKAFLENPYTQPLDSVA